MADTARSAGRSFLYVPADRRDRLEGAFTRGADALILDLEDAVSAQSKQAARATVADWLLAQSSPPVPLWVRINRDTLAVDIESAVSASVTGVMVPKAQPETLAEVDQLLGAQERRLGLAVGTFQVLALIETASALVTALDIARAPRVRRLGLGEADLAADLGLIPTAGREELTSIRLQIVVASAAAGIGSPVGPASTDFQDLEALRRSTELLLRLGFRSRTAIHPAQVPIINDVLSPTGEQVRHAKQVVASFEAAQRDGSGVTVDDKGSMVDMAIVRSARDVLARLPETLET